MTVRRGIRFMLAGCLGAGCALLVACGSSGKGLIPPSNAGPLTNDFEHIAAAVNAGDCSTTDTWLSRAQRDFDALGSSVDPGLKAKISQGLDNLRSIAPTACAQAQSQSSTTQSTTAPTTTQTTTTTNTTTPSTSTTTTTPPPTTTSTTPSTSTSTPTTSPTTTGGTAGGTPAPSGNGAGGAGAGGGSGQ